MNTSGSRKSPTSAIRRRKPVEDDPKPSAEPKSSPTKRAASKSARSVARTAADVTEAAARPASARPTAETHRGSAARAATRSATVEPTKPIAIEPVTPPETKQPSTVGGRRKPSGRPPRKGVYLRIPVPVLERWKAGGKGWQTRMIERLSAP